MSGIATPPVIEKPKRRRAARLAPAQRRSQLLQCAVELFAREGISHANHSDVAAVAGISLAAMFSYFPTHEALARAVLDHVSQFMLDDLVKPTQGAPETARVRIEKTLLGYARLIDTHRDITRIWLDWSTAVRGEAWPLYLQHHNKVRAIFETTLRQGQQDGDVAPEVNVHDAAWVTIGLAHMMTHMKFAGQPHLTIRRVVKDMLDSYLAGGREAG